MKKYLVFLLSVLLVLGTVSFAVADDAGMDSVRAMKPGAKVMLGGVTNSLTASLQDLRSSTDRIRWLKPPAIRLHPCRGSIKQKKRGQTTVYSPTGLMACPTIARLDKSWSVPTFLRFRFVR